MLVVERKGSKDHWMRCATNAWSDREAKQVLSYAAVQLVYMLLPIGWLVSLFLFLFVFCFVFLSNSLISRLNFYLVCCKVWQT